MTYLKEESFLDINKKEIIGRANRINLAFCNDNRFMGAASFASTGSIVGYDFIFNDVQDRLDPFDNETFDASPIEMYAVATDMLFGTAAYLPVKSAVLDLDAVRASTSLPLVTPPVEIDGHKYVDGGVADSVPIEHVLEHSKSVFPDSDFSILKSKLPQNSGIAEKSPIVQLCSVQMTASPEPSVSTTVGSPILFDRAYFDELLHLPEKAGGSHVLRQHLDVVQYVTAEVPEELMDVDTPEELKRLENLVTIE